MASRRLVPPSVREALLGIPSDIASLERNYLLADDDLDLIGTRRRPENRLGLALHIALLRHPGQGWHDDTEPPAPLVAWLAEQIEVPFPSLARYGSRGATRSNHRRLAVRHLGLRAFVPAHDGRVAPESTLDRGRAACRAAIQRVKELYDRVRTAVDERLDRAVPADLAPHLAISRCSRRES